MVSNIKDLNNLFQGGFIWIFTGVSAFLGYTMWDTSGSIRELAVEIKYITDQTSKYDDSFSNLNLAIQNQNNNIFSIREQQIGLSSQLSEYKTLSSIIRVNEKEITTLKEKIVRLEGELKKEE